jgi:hypothetical protein
LGLFGSAQEIFMFLHSIRVSLLALATAIILAACGGSSSSPPAPPEGGLSLTAGDSQIAITWKETPGVEYWIFAAPNNPTLNISNWLATTGSSYRLKVTSPFIVSSLSNGTPYSFFMTGRVNGGPGGASTPTVIGTPRLAGSEWTPGVNLNTGTQTGLTYGSFVDVASNTFKYMYLAVGNGGRMFKAESIGVWTAITPVVTSNLNSATFGFAKYIAAGDAGQIIYSSDMQTWTKATSTTTQNLNAVTANGSFVVAVGNNGTIITSKDAITWTGVASVPTSFNLYGVAYTASGIWIAVGEKGTVLISSDGATWTKQTTNVSDDLKAAGAMVGITNSVATYTYVVVGANGTVLNSSDAITWTARSTDPKLNLNALSADNQFIAVGATGAIFTSSNGIEWTSRVNNNTAELRTLLRAENKYIAVNSTGGILISQ